MEHKNEDPTINSFDTFCDANVRKKLMDKKYLVEMKTKMHHIKKKIDNDVIDLYKYGIEKGYDSKGVLGSKADLIKMYKVFFPNKNSYSNDLRNNRTKHSTFKQKRKIAKSSAFNTYYNIFQKNKKAINKKKFILNLDTESYSKNEIKPFNRTNNFISRNNNNSLTYRKNKTTNDNFFSTNCIHKKSNNINNKPKILIANNSIHKNNNNSSIFNLTGNSENSNIHNNNNKKIFDYSYKTKLVQKLLSINDANNIFLQDLEIQKIKDIKYKKFFKRQFKISKMKLISEDEKVMRSPNNNLQNNNNSSESFGIKNSLSNSLSNFKSMKRCSNYKDYLEKITSSMNIIKKRIEKENEFDKKVEDIFHENDLSLYKYKKIDQRLQNNFNKFK